SPELTRQRPDTSRVTAASFVTDLGRVATPPGCGWMRASHLRSLAASVLVFKSTANEPAGPSTAVKSPATDLRPHDRYPPDRCWRERTPLDSSTAPLAASLPKSIDGR